MTHEELLSEIDRELRMSDYDTWLAGARALRAVVELHKPDEKMYCNVCGFTWDTEPKYPCPTIQAIEKELK